MAPQTQPKGLQVRIRGKNSKHSWNFSLWIYPDQVKSTQLYFLRAACTAAPGKVPPPARCPLASQGQPCTARVAVNSFNSELISFLEITV